MSPLPESCKTTFDGVAVGLGVAVAIGVGDGPAVTVGASEMMDALVVVAVALICADDGVVAFTSAGTPITIQIEQVQSMATRIAVQMSGTGTLSPCAHRRTLCSERSIWRSNHDGGCRGSGGGLLLNACHAGGCCGLCGCCGGVGGSCGGCTKTHPFFAGIICSILTLRLFGWRVNRRNERRCCVRRSRVRVVGTPLSR